MSEPGRSIAGPEEEDEGEEGDTVEKEEEDEGHSVSEEVSRLGDATE